MSLGIIMLAHTALDRAAQVARHFAKADCPIVIHCDASVPKAEFDSLRASLSDIDAIRWAPRRSCDWGTWGWLGPRWMRPNCCWKAFRACNMSIWLRAPACPYAL